MIPPILAQSVDTVDLALRVVNFWQDALWLRGLSLLFGLILMAGTLRRVLTKFKKPRYRRARSGKARNLVARLNAAVSVLNFLCLVAALAFIVMGLAPSEMIRFVISMDYMARIRALTAIVGFLILLIAIDGIRNARLLERYAILWILTALTLLAASVLPLAVELIKAGLGLDYAGAVFSIGFFFLVLVSFHFSTSLSDKRRNIAKLSQEVAILRAEIESLKKEKDRGGSEEA